MHYFDAVYRKDLCGAFDRQFVTRLTEHVARLSDPPTPWELAVLRCLSLRLEMVIDPRRYRDLFQLIAREGHRVVGEITPSYSLLEEDGFAAIREMMPGAKFVFIMRDPVDRYWSHLRSHETNLGADRFSARAQLESKLSEPAYFLRTDYRRTLTALSRVVPPGDVCVLFYEHLMHPASGPGELQRLTGFLDVDHVASDLERRFGDSKPMELPEADAARVAAAFAPVYAYVAETFGDRLPDRWRERLAGLRTTP